MLRFPIKNKVIAFGFLLISVSLIVFTFFYFYNYIFPQTASKVVKLSTGWKYFTSQQPTQKELPLLRKPCSIKPNETLYLIHPLSANNPPILMVKNYYQQISVYIDNIEVLETPLGVGIHFITLPEIINESELRIEIRSPYTQHAGMPMPVYQGDIPSLYSHIFSKSIYHLFFMFVCTISGFFFIVTFILAYRKKRAHWDSFFLESFLFYGDFFVYAEKIYSF